MSDFQYVSLGFAEFVGQLLTETFEATINAQQYQLRRYAELQAAIDLPDEQFLLQFIDPQLVLTRETLIAGSPIARQMIVPPERQAFILELTEEFEEESVIFKNRLTNYGFEALRAVIDEQLVAEQKASLQALLNRMEQARLVVDSGEINAKLELSSLYQTTTDATETAAGNDGKTAVSGVKRLAASDAVLNTTLVNSTLSSGVKELVDAETLEKTLFLDGATLDKTLAATADSPVRISAKPLPSSTSSSVYSQVTIRFKTV